MGWLSAVMGFFAQFIPNMLKMLFGTDKPQKVVVEHPKPEVEVTDGKTDADRLKDLGL